MTHQKLAAGNILLDNLSHQTAFHIADRIASDTAAMVRKLKHHEQKLLKKTDFITYKQDNGHRDHNVIRRYMIQKPEDYNKYNRLCGVSAF